MSNYEAPEDPAGLTSCSASQDSGGITDVFLSEIADFGPHTDRQEKAINEVAARLSEWERTFNPFFVERAFEISVRFALEITATLRVEMVEAIQLRRKGYKGSWGQVVRWEWKPRAYLLICNLVFHRLPLNDAASIASRWLDHRSAGKVLLKASTLQRDYVEDWRKSGIESDFHSAFADKSCAKDRSDWLDFARNAPRATESMTGTRR